MKIYVIQFIDCAPEAAFRKRKDAEKYIKKNKISPSYNYDIIEVELR